jgi:thiamine-phosphate pyrophosphorylase
LSRLYIISPEKIDANFANSLKLALSGGDIAYFQLRLKNIDDESLIQYCEQLYPICQKYGVKFLLNDYSHLIGKAPLDGVHIGQFDGTVAQIRQHHPDIIIGSSCYDDAERARKCATDGANYVAFGAFFPTKTKITTARPKIEILEQWKENSQTPVAAIGGLNPENCLPMAKAGADFICAVSYIWQHQQSPKHAVEEFNRALQSFRN